VADERGREFYAGKGVGGWKVWGKGETRSQNKKHSRQYSNIAKEIYHNI
jgi:hypothetical protein